MEEIRKSGLTFQEAKNLVDVSIRDVKDGFVATGYYLWIIREERLWKDDGYNSFQEFLHCQYQKDKSWASRCIGLYEKFGKQIPFGELPVLAAPYRDYSLSQLIEMVPMTEEQREQVTPDMKVREIRELKPKREKKTKGQKETPSDDEDSIPGQRSLEDNLTPVATVATEEGQETAQGAREPLKEAGPIRIAPEPEKGQETAQEAPQGAREWDGNEAAGKGIPAAEGGTNEPKSGMDMPESGADGPKREAESLKVKIYDRDLLLQMISNAEYEMKLLGEYWIQSGPEYYTQKAMEIQAYKNLLAEHDAEEAAASGLAENPEPYKEEQ